LANWQQIKQAEKREKGIDVDNQSLLDGVPVDLPTLYKATEVQKRAAKVGFDWTEVEPVVAKIREELDEVLQVMATTEAGDSARADELGDLLFAVVNLSRFIKVDADQALAGTVRKFTRRFQYIELKIAQSGRNWSEYTLDELDIWWNEAKNTEK
jgi:tetrapyrrole methylase family protein/MazG family protein